MWLPRQTRSRRALASEQNDRLVSQDVLIGPKTPPTGQKRKRDEVDDTEENDEVVISSEASDKRTIQVHHTHHDPRTAAQSSRDDCNDIEMCYSATKCLNLAGKKPAGGGFPVTKDGSFNNADNITRAIVSIYLSVARPDLTFVPSEQVEDGRVHARPREKQLKYLSDWKTKFIDSYVALSQNRNQGSVNIEEEILPDEAITKSNRPLQSVTASARVKATTPRRLHELVMP